MILVNMMNSSKDIINVTCKNHINRSEKDLYRICPSKLNKQELEDVYFALFESNIQLKKTLNGQQDEIKILTTKVQRLTAQKPVLRNRNKDCCAKSMTVINEQKETITDLKKVNERLSDRIRLLNIKLCSAKQYLRRSPAQSTSRCSKCCLAFNTSIKNSSMSALYTKRSETNLKTTATSCEFLDKENVPVKLTEIVSTQTENKSQGTCEQNRCRTTKEELTQKIFNIEEELSRTHERYSERLTKLDEEVNMLTIENTRMRAERTAGEEELQIQKQQFSDLLEQLQGAEERCDDLTAQLLIEKGKVSELEMLVKAAEISSQVAKTLEKQINSSLLLVPNNTTISVNEGSSNKVNNSDDSGYTETNKSQDNMKKESNLDQDILDQIANLKEEIDSLKLSLKDDQKRTLKEPTQSNVEASLYSTDNVSTSHIEITENLHLLHSILHTQEVITTTGDIGYNLNKQSICDKQTDDINDQTLTSKISGIPRLNKNAKNVLQNSKPYTNHRNNSDIDDNLATKLKNDNLNDKIHNVFDNREISKTEEDKEANNRKSTINVNLKLDKDDSVNTDSQTSNTDSSQVAKGIIDNENNNDPIVNKENKISKVKTNKNEGIEPYGVVNKVESPKAKDLKVTSNIVRRDKIKLKKNEEHLKDSVEQKKKAKVKRRMSHVIETKSNKNKLIKAASEDLGSKTYSIEPRKPLATSSPNRQGTYIVRSSSDTRPSSADTECEISSLTDLPNEMDDKSPFDYISPGEERAMTTFSDSYTTTTDYGSLSEGELPTTRRRSSYTEVDVKNKMAETFGGKSSNMEETLRAISEEVSRCKRLLRTQVTFPDIPTYNYTLPLN